MDLLINEIRSLQSKVDGLTKKLDSLDTKVDEFTEPQQVGGETVPQSANSINIIIRFLSGLRRLTPEELKNTLFEAEAILNTVHPISTDQNPEQILEWHDSKDKLKTILKEVFDLLNSLSLNDANHPVASTSIANHPVASTSIADHLVPSTSIADHPVPSTIIADHPVASTSIASRNVKNKGEDENKIKFWRRYKNKYNYIEKLKLKLPPLDNPVEEAESSQNDVNANKQNDVNNTEQNDVNDTAQNDLNDKSYTLDDIIQNFEVYEMFKSRLKNSPYDDPYFKNNVKNSNLCLTLHNGETIVKPVSHVAPLIVLKKCDDLCPIPLQNKKITGKHVPSTSKKDSNTNIATTSGTQRKTRSNKTMDSTNSINTNVKATTKKRSLTIKNSKNEPSKKTKKLKKTNIL